MLLRYAKVKSPHQQATVVPMLQLIIGLVLFLGSHSIAILAPAWRERMIARLGKNGWRGLYTLVSIVGFALLIWGYGIARAEPTVLYVPPAWLRYVAALLILPAFPLVFAFLLPSRLRVLAKHPLLLATKLWAFAHLLVNGGLAEVLLFGSFLVWAIADRISVKHRPPKAVAAPPASKVNDAIAILAGLALYVLFMASLHMKIIGVPVFPGM